jgi:hypothetical protein
MSCPAPCNGQTQRRKAHLPKHTTQPPRNTAVRSAPIASPTRRSSDASKKSVIVGYPRKEVDPRMPVPSGAAWTTRFRPPKASTPTPASGISWTWPASWTSPAGRPWTSPNWWKRSKNTTAAFAANNRARVFGARLPSESADCPARPNRPDSIGCSARTTPPSPLAWVDANPPVAQQLRQAGREIRNSGRGRRVGGQGGVGAVGVDRGTADDRRA